MESSFCCPRCGSLLNKNPISYSCTNCKNPQVAKNEDGYIDFIKTNYERHNVNTQIFTDILKIIDDLGYKKGLELISTKYSERKHEFDETLQSADGLFHCIGEQNDRCLDMGSNLGDISEGLSYFFKDVYSIEPDIEKIEFQKRRFKFKNKKNIILIRSFGKKLPFPDNHFDLIILNGLEQITNLFTENLYEKSENEFLTEIKRILKNNGCLLLGVDNKQGIDFIGNRSKKQTQKLAKEDFKKYNHTFHGYQSLLNEVGFTSTAYWILPSLKFPFYSGKINDEKSLRWFLANSKNFIPSFKKKSFKQKLLLSFLYKFNPKLITFLTKKFIPSFLFCCYKNNITTSLEKNILQKYSFTTSLMISRRHKIMYVLFGKNGLPKKVASLMKYSSLPEIQSIKSHDQYFDYTELENRTRIEDWKEGRILDPLNKHEILKAIEWIIYFQKSHQLEEFSDEEISSEINKLKVTILGNPKIDKKIFSDWIAAYEIFMKKNKIKKSAIHGDLSHKNMIINPSNGDLNVIDWYFFKETGNPLDDISNFLFRLLVKSNKLNKIEAFKTKVSGLDNQFNELRQKIEEKLTEHFSFKIDLILIIKIHLLKAILLKIQQGEDIQDELKYVTILADYSNVDI